MNRTTEDAAFGHHHPASQDEVRPHLQLIVDAYDDGRRPQTLRGPTPDEGIVQAWTKQPGRFRLGPSHHMPGPNISQALLMYRGMIWKSEMKTPVSVPIAIGLIAIVTSARAGIGIHYSCPIEGVGAAEVVLDANGRSGTVDLPGKRYDVEEEDGRLRLHAGVRFYSFTPSSDHSPAEMTIVTPDERKVVECTGP